MRKTAIAIGLVAVAIMLVLGTTLMRGRAVQPAIAPAAPPAKQESLAEDAIVPRLERTIQTGAIQPGETVEVTLTVHYDGADPILALAIEEHLPEGWSFQRMSNGAQPAITPEAGAVGTLTFVWIQVPVMPMTFNYFAVPETAAAGNTFVGNLVYRRTGDEERGGLVVSEIQGA